MADHFLTKTQRNQVLGAVQEAGLDPAEFMWGTMRTEKTQIGLGQEPMDVPVLMHEPSGFYFKFDLNEPRRDHWAIFVPGTETSTERRNAGTWDYEIAYVQEWLEIVAREYSAVDLWAELGRERQLIEAAAPGTEEENRPFTPEEQAQISMQLGELKEYVRAAHELTTAQLTAINARLDYAEASAHRMGRIDWLNAFVGSLVSLVLGAIVPPGVVQDALRVVGRALGHMFGAGPPELPGAPL